MIGFIDWYDDRGYGLIKSVSLSSDGKSEFFLHHSKIRKGYNLVPGDMLFFMPGYDGYRKRDIAIDVKPFTGEINEWESVLEYIDLETLTANKVMRAALIENKKNGQLFYEKIKQWKENASLEKVKAYGQILTGKEGDYIRQTLVDLGHRYDLLVDNSDARIKDWKDRSIPVCWLHDEDVESLIGTVCDSELNHLKKHPNWQAIACSYVRKLIDSSKLDTTEEISLIERNLSLISEEALHERMKVYAISKMDKRKIALNWLEDHIPDETVSNYSYLLKDCFATFKRLSSFVPTEVKDIISENLIKLTYRKIDSISNLLTFIDSGYLPDLGDALISDDSILKLKFDDLEALHGREYISDKFYKEILERLFDLRQFSLYLNGVRLLENESFISECAEKVKSQVSDWEYFILWRNKCVKEVPYQTISSGILDAHIGFEEVDKWIQSGEISIQKLISILQPIIEKCEICSSRRIFNLVRNYVLFLKRHDYSLGKIVNLPNYPLIDWINNITDDSLFKEEYLRGHFAVLPHIDQRRVLKRLFYLKNVGLFDFSVIFLLRLVSDGYKAVKENQQFSDVSVFDLSTSLVLSALKTYSEFHTFPVEGELYRIFNETVNIYSKENPEIGFYFDVCEGKRELYVANPVGDIRHQGNHFVIRFKYNASLVESLKSHFTNRRYDSANQSWIVPESDYDRVLSFARKYAFTLDGNTETLYHLYDVRNKGTLRMPHYQGYFEKHIAIRLPYFCEGMKSQKKYKGHDCWICRHMTCYETCRNLHGPEQWEKYTLLDFLSILGFDTEGLLQITTVGNVVPDGKYLQFIGFVNRFREVLEHLYCRACGKVMLPYDTSNYNSYAVTQFSCYNPDCPEYKNCVYINHCMNGYCLAVIDSRDTKECPNHWRICPECASCCDKDLGQRGLMHAKVTGGYVARKWQHTIDHPHNPNEFYCPDCGLKMESVSEQGDLDDIFTCPSCAATFKRRKNDFGKTVKGLKRIH